MVRVHVRPPSFNCRTLCPARVFGKSRERRLPTRLEAGHSAASRQERNSILIPSAAGLWARGAIDQVVFSSRSEAPPSPRGERRESTTGRPGAEFGVQAVRARGGCLGGGRR